MIQKSILLAIIAMIILVVASNFLVQFPINDWLTWGALTYPVTFLVTELTNRAHGPSKARLVVYIGFTAAVLLSILLATPRIAFASGTAFLCSQLLDVTIFSRARSSYWWWAPLAASLTASFVDTFIFFCMAFWGDSFPWVTLALGDFFIKLGIDCIMLLPFRLLTTNLRNRAFQRSP